MTRVRKKPTRTITKRKPRPRTQMLSHVAIVLDNSGSMQSIRQATIDAFNEQVRSIRAATAGKNIKTKVTFITFDTKVNEPKYFAADLESLKELTWGDYNPDGWTALYDGVGTTIDKLCSLAEINNEKTTVLVVIISDGAENHSVAFNQHTLAEKIKKLQETKRWTFTYSGANQDLSVVSSQLNIPILNTQAFAATSAGMKGAAAQRSRSIGTYYSNVSLGVTGMSNFYQDDSKTPVDPKDQAFLNDSTDDDKKTTTSSTKSTK